MAIDGLNDERRCFTCQRPGHLKRDCRMNAQGQRSGLPGNSGGGGLGRRKGRGPPKCRRCDQLGHIRDHCTVPQAECDRLHALAKKAAKPMISELNAQPAATVPPNAPMARVANPYNYPANWNAGELSSVMESQISTITDERVDERVNALSTAVRAANSGQRFPVCIRKYTG